MFSIVILLYWIWKIIYNRYFPCLLYACTFFAFAWFL